MNSVVFFSGLAATIIIDYLYYGNRFVWSRIVYLVGAIASGAIMSIFVPHGTSDFASTMIGFALAIGTAINTILDKALRWLIFHYHAKKRGLDV